MYNYNTELVGLHKKPGRYTDFTGIGEVKDLKAGMDFRHPKYRREVFKRFYEFHNKYLAHPGFVYAAIPYFMKKLGVEERSEAILWLCFINGVTQNIVTTETIFNEFPEVPKDSRGVEKIHKYVMDHWKQLQWDQDRKYTKAKMGTIVQSYVDNIAKHGGSQDAMFKQFTDSDDVKKNFRKMWDFVFNNFFLFGRLSTFSYLEYLRLAGVPIDCDSLFLDDISGSKSHRNGLCKILGRDDLDWHDTENPEFDGGYTSEVMQWLVKEGDTLLEEMKKERYHKDVSFFTMESCMCAFKSFFRKNRRYPGVYLDMHHDRIKRAELEWGDKKSFGEQWRMRGQYLPYYLKLEDKPNDPGLKPEKQNYFRETGKIIQMSNDDPVFANAFDDMIFNKNSTQGLEGLFA